MKQQKHALRYLRSQILIFRVAVFLSAVLSMINTRSYGQSPSDRRKFPFSKAQSILLISFTAPSIREPGIIYPEGDVAGPKPVVRNRAFRDTLGHEEVREIVCLSTKGRGELSAVLNKLLCHGTIKHLAGYSPRNAALFMGGDGRILAELEVCFECLGFETKPSDLYVRDSRECMYDALKKVFAKAGVKYGVVANK